ncbi:hypothetical protein CEXT_777061 [Caerostris extrusa]|uniref:Uncharacterized protein n=1 Tax=Caerostris extrusa TaxID=172846 RepID=A0AAV4V603_CAEEX|nr:hypothetical protein CEXT_777061 [Caerostris extrusa]
MVFRAQDAQFPLLHLSLATFNEVHQGSVAATPVTIRFEWMTRVIQLLQKMEVSLYGRHPCPEGGRKIDLRHCCIFYIYKRVGFHCP